MIRFLDIALSFIGLVLLSPAIVILYIFCWLDTGSPLFVQSRLGKNIKEFNFIKFRTLGTATPNVPSHSLSAVDISRFGACIRRLKFDEFPQLWNVLKGEMSIVGPRPGLQSQHELTAAREKLGVFEVRPGITGLAQINRIDMSTPDLLAQTDARMIAEASVRNYFKYIFLTVLGRGSGDRVKS